MAPGNKVDWSAVETWQKLLAAVVASGVKIDNKPVATHFGTTYDTIENRMRPIKKQAKALQDAVEDGTLTPATPARKVKQTAVTPKKSATDLKRVTKGRVTKKVTPPKTSTTKQALKNVKIEAGEDVDNMDDVVMDTEESVRGEDREIFE